jgi:alpha-tubulin suppressor-like RCC1 family protein
VQCWGRNNLGQLGDPAIVGPTPDAQTVLLDRPPQTMSAGRDHTCVIVTDGTLRCWGSNVVGQIGNGGTANATTPVFVAGPPGVVVALTSRLDTTCAMTGAGDVYCWGDSFGPDLGADVPAGEPVLSPARIDVVDELPEHIAELDAGRSHLCARAATGRLWCWGADDTEQLGPIAPQPGKRAVEIDLECP